MKKILFAILLTFLGMILFIFTSNTENTQIRISQIKLVELSFDNKTKNIESYKEIDDTIGFIFDENFNREKVNNIKENVYDKINIKVVLKSSKVLEMEAYKKDENYYLKNNYGTYRISGDEYNCLYRHFN